MKLPGNAGAVAILKSGFGNPAESGKIFFLHFFALRNFV